MLVLCFDMIYSVFFIIFLLIFKYVARRDIRRVQSQYYSSADYTLYIKGIPKDGVTEEEVKELFEKNFGAVHEVVLCKKYGGALTDYHKQDKYNKAIRI